MGDAAPTPPTPVPPLPLDAPLTSIPGIGPRRAKALMELGVRNVGQLVAYLPMRHERQEAESTISELKPEAVVSARGMVAATRLAGRLPKQRLEAALVDDTGRIDLVWFNGAYLRNKIQPGVRLFVQGKARKFGQTLQMANPKFELLNPEAEPEVRDERLRPVYPASEGITSQQIEAAVQHVLEPALRQIQDHLPERFRDERELLELTDAYRALHKAETEGHAAAGRRRLAYDELLLLQLGMAIKRHTRERHEHAPALRWSAAIDKAIRARFPFTLTGAQDLVVREMSADLQRTVPANRLIQGDVGSGKTVVALYGLLMAAAARRQGALMAPTEILAEQHHASITRMLQGSDVRVELLTGALPPSQRAAVAAGVADGSVDLVIGTHALLSEGVAFKSLAVAVIDEQHRFGVHQRMALREKGAAGEGVPHTIVMTATPIPRTLAMTLFGDLDVSTIRELPPGRKPIATRVVGFQMAEEVWAFVRKRLDKGEQAYVVVPAIEGDAELFQDPSEAGAPKLASVADTLAQLEAGPLRGKRLAGMHGRHPRDVREAIMNRFRQGQIDVLVSTTVIEVGVDVPNATVMVVIDADRFGLAQLHQLRGRVGRGSASSACILIGQGLGEQAAARLQVMAKVSDGFTLAEKDLEIRGFGELIGTRQSGMPPFRVVNFHTDAELLQMARRDATAWIEASPTLARPEEALLKRRLLKAHGQWMGLADVG